MIDAPKICDCKIKKPRQLDFVSVPLPLMSTLTIYITDLSVPLKGVICFCVYVRGGKVSFLNSVVDFGRPPPTILE